MTTAVDPWWRGPLLAEFWSQRRCGNSSISHRLERARAHRVELLLLDTVSQLVGLSDDLDGDRRALAAANRAHRLLAAQAIRDVLAVIDAPAVVIKGPAIAHRWYEHPDHRPFGDVDVLVRRRDFPHAVDLLERNGGEVLLRNWRGFLRRGVAEIPVRWGHCVIDLHWDVVALAATRQSVRFDVDGAIDRSVDLDLPGVRARTLDPVDTLLHACTNFGLGGGRRWGQLIDVGLIAEGTATNADEFVERCESSGVGALAAAVLHRSRRVAGAPIDPSLERRLEPWRGWLVTNTIIDSAARTGHHSRVGPGFWVASGRPSAASTFAAGAGTLSESIRRMRGAPSLTDPGGDLDWYAADAEHDQSRAAYLGWVGLDEDVQRVRRPSVELLDQTLGPIEPRSTPTLGLARRTSGAGTTTAFTKADGTIAAVLATDDWGPLRRTGYPVVIDPTAARDLADEIDALGVTELAGFDIDLDVLRPLVRRWGVVTPATPVALPPGSTWESPPSTTRRAEQRDLERMTELMWKYAVHGYPTRGRLRRRLRRAIDELVIVCETDGVVTGLAVRESSTPRYHYWSTMLVEPTARGAGRSWDLIAAIVHEAFAVGAGAVGFGASSNPMPAPTDSLLGGTWEFVELRPPNRWLGERRFRRWIASAERTLGRTSEPDLVDHRHPGSDDDLVTERRTQRWWSQR